jgi:hypothetical protein
MNRNAYVPYEDGHPPCFALTDPDFDGLLAPDQRPDEERERAVREALEECRVSIGGKRGDRIVALLYLEVGLSNPKPNEASK